MNSKAIWKGIVFSLLLSFLGYAIFLQTYQTSFLNKLCKEDGLVEWLTALLYFLAAGFFALGLKNQNFRNLWYGFFSGLFFVIAGEEISWGQRLFGIDTPTELNNLNVQNELNFHNIYGIHDKVRLIGVLVVFLICYVLPLSNWLSPVLKSYYQKFKLPVYPLWLSGIVTMALSLMVVPRLALGKEVFNLDEVGELYLAIGFFGFSLAAYFSALALKRRLATEQTFPLEGQEHSVESSTTTR